ncbi:MAG TPA: hypothetical protein ENK59_07705 [Thioploca sp.]|nr:hypothetical protein [Thioploca sp.]
MQFILHPMPLFRMKKLTIVMVLAAILGGAKAYLDHQLHVELDKAIINNQVAIEFSQITSSLLGQVIINNLRISKYIHIDKIILSKAYQFYNQLPESISINLEGIKIPINKANQPIPIIISTLGYAPYYISLKELYNLGYINIYANMSIIAKLQKTKLSLVSMINADIFGKYIISVEFNRPSKSFDTMELVSLQLEYFDNGLVNKVLSYLALRNNETSQQLQQKFITKLNNDIKQQDIINNLYQFLKNPKSLTINLQPKLPMDINTLKTLPIQQFKLQITT